MIGYGELSMNMQSYFGVVDVAFVGQKTFANDAREGSASGYVRVKRMGAENKTPRGQRLPAGERDGELPLRFNGSCRCLGDQLPTQHGYRSPGATSRRQHKGNTRRHDGERTSASALDNFSPESCTLITRLIFLGVNRQSAHFLGAFIRSLNAEATRP